MEDRVPNSEAGDDPVMASSSAWRTDDEREEKGMISAKDIVSSSVDVELEGPTLSQTDTQSLGLDDGGVESISRAIPQTNGVIHHVPPIPVSLMSRLFGVFQL